MTPEHGKDVDALLSAPLDELTDLLEEMCVTVGARILTHQAQQQSPNELASSQRLTQDLLVYLDEIRTVVMAISTKNAVDDVYHDFVGRLTDK